MKKIKGHAVTPQQADIYALIKRFGSHGISDHGLVAIARTEMKRAYSESGIRSRRAELTDKGLLKQVGKVATRSGRQARRWAVV